MQLKYNGVEIFLNVEECRIKDNMGGKVDSLTISFADIKGECRKWQFEKGDIIEAIDRDFSTGLMYVDEFYLRKGKFIVKALSLRKKIKSKKNRSWENVNFLDFARDIANENELVLEIYGVDNFRYSIVAQINQNDIEFLNHRCNLEGLNLKISNGKLIIVSESFLINQSKSLTLDKTDFLGDYKFKCTSNGIYGGCEITSFSRAFIRGSYKINDVDPVLKINDIAVNSLAEANRFSKNITVSANKYEITGEFVIRSDVDITAGNLIYINLDNFTGFYVIESVIRNMLNSKLNIVARKVVKDDSTR